MIYHLSVKILVVACASSAVVCAELSWGVKGHLIYHLTAAILVRAITAGVAQSPRSCCHQMAVAWVLLQQRHGGKALFQSTGKEKKE